jgi:iron(III) transport system permease protein
MIRNHLSRRVALVGLAAVLFAYVLYPQVIMISGSLQVDGKFSLDHYTRVLDASNSANVEAVVNSIAVSILSVVLGGIAGGLFAFTFTQFQFPFSTSLSRLAVLPLALPPLVGVISFLFVFGESGLLPRILQKLLMSAQVPFYLDGFWAIVTIHVYSFYVYFYLFISNSLRQLDSSLVEAASSLGSSQWNTFRRVVLPELRPALVGASILTFMASMASFSAPLIFGGEHRFLTTQIYTTKLNGDLDTAAAQSVLLTLVSIGFFLVFTLSNRPSVGAGKTRGSPRAAEIRVSPWLRRALVMIAVMLLTLELLPILTIVVISFVRESSWTWQVFPTEYTVENYAKLFLDQRVFEPIQNSVLMAFLTIIGALVFGVSASLIVVKGGLKRFRVAVDLLLTLSFAIPGTVVAIGLIYAFNKPTVFTGYTVLVGTFWILPLAYFIRTYPLVVRATSASLEQLDDSLMEAGETFGASLSMRLRKIALPIILPGIVSGSLLVAIAALGEFVSSIMLYTYSSRPISMEILSQLRGYNFGAAAAYSVFLLVVIFLLTVLSNRLSRTEFERRGLNF